MKPITKEERSGRMTSAAVIVAVCAAVHGALCQFLLPVAGFSVPGPGIRASSGAHSVYCITQRRAHVACLSYSPSLPLWRSFLPTAALA